jgi:ribosomal protein L29
MKKLNYFAFVAMVALLISNMLLLSSCNDKKIQEEDIETTSEENEETAQQEALWEKANSTMPDTDTLALPEKLTMLNDSVITTWNRLLSAEREKDDMLQKFIREARFVEGFNGKELIDKLETERKALLKLRYDNKTMQNAKTMDAYDKKLAQIQTLVKQIKESNPELERYPVPYSVITYFSELDNIDFLLRKNYTEYASKLNKLLMVKKDEIPALGEQFVKIKPASKFEYGELN